MRIPDNAEVLLRKAKGDESTVEKLLPDPTSHDEIIGFHAQQAVEKLLKAVLAYHAVPYPRIHDLTELVDLLRENKISFPVDLEEIDRLTPFATVFRYAELSAEPPRAFNRSWALELVRRVRAWAEALVQES
jgi:HEPN domain-containing protein